MRNFLILVAFFSSQNGWCSNDKPSLNPVSFWEFVDKAVASHPEQLAAKATIEAQTAQAKSLGWLEDPSIEFSQTSRTAARQDSTVGLVAVRQKLPFWSQRSRQQEVQLTLVEASKHQQNEKHWQLEFQLVKQLYSYARAVEEQHHLKERRERLNLIKTAMARTRSASPAQQVERNLVASAISLTEQQFDIIDTQVSELRKILLSQGLPGEANVTVNWMSPAIFTKFKKNLPTNSLRPNAKIETRRSVVLASEKNLIAMKPRPEFDLLLQKDQESGGAQEQNLTVGLAVKIPINALFGPQTKMGQAEVEKSKAELSLQEKASNIELANFTEEIQLAEKSLTRFEFSNIHAIEAIVTKAEQDVRRGWISVAQLLELERQMHAQIEATFDAQILAMETIKKACTIYSCDAREYLGGSL